MISQKSILAAVLLGLGVSATSSRSQETEPTVWDVKKLEVAPQFQWIDRSHPIHSLTYTGQPFQGQNTEVFAFYASPATIGDVPGEPAKKPFPGVVLIHGGGGTAFSEWVHLWAKRGYAAIAMDLSGRRPPDPEYDAKTGAYLRDMGNDVKTRTRLEHGGPEHGHPEKFDSIGGDHTDDWPWHAVSSVVLAHSLLRSFPEVDPDRTAVTGISWGGYTTCLVASVDSRFKAAVPVYGCGFLFEGESVQKKAIDALDPERRALWIKRYDPSSHLGNCHVPIFFVNGSHDIHYPLDSYARCYALVPGEKQIRIEPRMRHGHPPGWAPQEIGWFIDSHCNGGTPLPHPGPPMLNADGTVTVTVKSQTPIKEATLHYTEADGLRSEREWKSVPATVAGKTITSPALPAATNTWFITLNDDRGAMVSTEVRFSDGAIQP